MNKRPIRRRDAADEWTFRFQAWHRLGFPGSTGSLQEKLPPGAGSLLGSAGSQNSHFPLAAGLVGRGKSGGRAWAYTSGLRSRASPHPDFTGPLPPPAAAPRRHPRTSKADCGNNNKGRPRKMCRYPKKPAVFYQTLGRGVRCGNST